MGHRSQIIREQQRMQHTSPSPLLIRDVQQAPLLRPAPQGQATLAQLVPLLLQMGHLPKYKTGVDLDQKVVFLAACVGELEIPMAFNLADGEQLIATLDDKLQMLRELEQEEAPIPLSPAAEELLAEAIAAAAPKVTPPACPGCQSDLTGSEASTTDGQFMSDKFYCHPCARPVDLATSGETAWVPGAVETQRA